MANLRLFFSGLCGFVPSSSLASAVVTVVNVSAVRVLLTDARGSHPNHGPHQHEHHEPVLVVPNAWVVNTAPYRQPTRTFTKSGSGTLYAVFYLADQDLEISGASGGVNVTVGKADVCPAANETTSFAWVAPMEGINPGHGAARKDCFRPGGDPNNPVYDAVVARVRLTGGTLTTSRFSRETETGPHRDKIIHWGFKTLSGTGPSTLHQALAEETELSHPLTGRAIELTTVYLRNGSTTSETIRLKASGTEDIEAYVLNMPWPDILGTRPVPSPVPARQEDFHFEHFYPLLDNPPADKQVPVPLNPHDYCPDPSHPGPAVSNPQCPPSQYAPDSGA